MKGIGNPIRWAIVGMTLVCLSACKQTGTTSGNPKNGNQPIATQSMYLHVLVREYGPTNVEVITTLNDDSAPLDPGHPHNNKYVVDGGDTLRACMGAECVALNPNRDALFGITQSYSGMLPFSADSPYVVSFSRPAATSAIDSRVTLPPAFDITEPVNQQAVGDGQSIHLSWWPIAANEHVAIRKQVHCTASNFHTLTSLPTTSIDTGGDGYEDYSVDELVAFARIASPTWPGNTILNCDISFEVTHERHGTVDPNFRGGETTGVVARYVTASYTPTP